MSNIGLTERLKELTNVGFERDSAETENEHSSLRSLLTQFMEDEARSCSMDFGCVTPEYVYRMWGGRFSMEDIESAMVALRQAQEPVRRQKQE